MTKQYAAELKAWAKKRAAILRLSRKGVPKTEIARKFNVSRQRIQAIVKQEIKNEIPRPDRQL